MAGIGRMVGVGVGAGRSGRRIAGIAAALIVGLVIGLGDDAAAQGSGRRFTMIRDAEIEHIIRSYARPIFDAAGLDSDAVAIALVRDPTLNAFVAGGMNIFLFTGLLLEVAEPSELIGVIAHETGHIAGGHLVRGRARLEQASAEAILSTLVGVGVAVLAGRGDAAAAAAVTGSEFARRRLLAFIRAQESAADQAALTLLDRAGISGRGLLAFLERLADQELLPESRQDPYLRTHPLTRSRVDTVRHFVERSRHADRALPARFAEWHRRMQAKLFGFLYPDRALRRYRADAAAVAPRYGRAIALYRRSLLAEALPVIDRLIAEEPTNAFFHELKGQMLLENGRPAAALPSYRRAVELKPDSGLLRAALAQTLLQTPDVANARAAVVHLAVARRFEPRSPFVWRLLATAHGRLGEQGLTAYALAEEALARGDRALARAQAARAEALLPAGTPGWLRAQDIRAVADGPE